MKTKIKIKTVFEKIIFEHECENNTIAKTVNEYIMQELKKGLSFADLRFADLSFADLSSAGLNSADLSSADLSFADLSYADLCSADLCSADLSSANLRFADLNYANLRFADLSFADLSSAGLNSADLSFANLRSANLRFADLSYADLCSADLCSADLSSANLRNLKHNECTRFLLPQCPPEGSFIGWKKVGKMIVKLLVTEDAKRSSATTLKCRCSKAKVLAIENIDGSESGLKEVESSYDSNFVYRVGEIVEVENFDEDRWNECSTGIHFFIARESAVAYQ